MVDIVEPDAAEKAFMAALNYSAANMPEDFKNIVIKAYRAGRMDEARRHSHELNAILSICEAMTRKDPQVLTP